MEAVKLTRQEVLKGYKWKEGLINLSLSNHCRRRIEERVDGEFPIVPTMVRITEKNICSGRAKGKKLTSVKIRLDYKSDKWMYLIICPWSGVVKTLYINYKDVKKNAPFKGLKASQEEEVCCEEEAIKEKTQIQGDNFERERRAGENVQDVPRDMGKTQGFWEKFFRSIWKAHIWGMLICVYASYNT